MNPKCTSEPPKDQSKLDFCGEVQWQTQGKACCRWFSHPRTCGEHLLRSNVPETPKLVISLGELNKLELWGADIGNAYIEAYTHEKLFIIAWAEFEELEGFIPVLNNALYGLKSCRRGGQKSFITSSRTWDSCHP